MSRAREKHLTPQGGTPFVAFLQMLQELTHLQDIYYLLVSKQKKYTRSPRRLWPNLARSVRR